MEHRWGCRVRVDHLSQVVDANGARNIVLVRDVSTTGAFIETSAPLPHLSRVAVFLVAPPLEADWVDGYVVRRTEDGIGIEWGDFAPALAVRLMALTIPKETPESVSTSRRAAAHPRPARASGWL